MENCKIEEYLTSDLPFDTYIFFFKDFFLIFIF